jgi:L-seryl-tRNA(Ser) seleniumtransferase
MVEVATPEEFLAALGPRTAMVMVLAGRMSEEGPLSLRVIAELAAPRSVPVLVDAAADELIVPNPYLEQGADLVAYSGGKCLRGPQCAGLLVGRKDLVQAAWVHSAPHHGYARGMKVGREEMVGMLVAVESWVKRDHAAEWKQWVARCDYIAERVSKIAGVTALVQREPGASLSNRSPRVVIRWHAGQRGTTGPAVVRMLDAGEPRIAASPLGRGGAQADDGAGDTGISIVSAMMTAGDEKIVAQRIHGVLSASHTMTSSEAPAAPAADISGRWDVEIRYAASTSSHTLHLVQSGNRLEGIHQGNFLTRDISGTITGAGVALASIVTERHGDALTYRFSGTVEGGAMSGSLDLGEYLSATWTARKGGQPPFSGAPGRGQIFAQIQRTGHRIARDGAVEPVRQRVAVALGDDAREADRRPFDGP